MHSSNYSTLSFEKKTFALAQAALEEQGWTKVTRVNELQEGVNEQQ